MRRVAAALMGAAVAVVLMATPALAAPQLKPVTQGSGAGQSHLSAAFGFNMDLNLNGQFEYNADPNGPYAGFRAHCSGYVAVWRWVMWDGAPALRFRSNTCVDQDGNGIFLRGKIADYGEPGVNDYAHVLFCTELNQNGQCPLYGPSVIVSDNGKIQNGNIQILHY